jgi:DNA topoisomerase VI subunit B
VKTVPLRARASPQGWTLDGTSDGISTIVIKDNGPGIPAETIEGILDYSIRVSSREAYVSPTRGAQGNALKTILPMGYVLQDGEDAASETIIEAHGVAHHILFSVDHIRQEPKIEHTTKPSSVTEGTRITVSLPNYNGGNYRDVDMYGAFNAVAACEDEFLKLAESYACLNPHLSLSVTWNGECKLDIKASNPNWKKWLPRWPTSAHWYNTSRFRVYMAAHIANRGSVTVREFVSEFDGFTGTAKQKVVLNETGASHRSLHDFFGLKKANIDNIKKLLASLKQHSKPVRPAQLGLIGKEHLFHMMQQAGGDPLTFTYEKRLGEDNGLPSYPPPPGCPHGVRTPTRREPL